MKCFVCKRKSLGLGPLQIARLMIVTLGVFVGLQFMYLWHTQGRVLSRASKATVDSTPIPPVHLPVPFNEKIGTNGKFLMTSSEFVLTKPTTHGVYRVYGKRRQYTGFVTIGIPSVKRPNTEQVYLYETLGSIIKNTDNLEKNSTVVVVQLADDNATYNEHVTKVLYLNYKDHFDSGFLQVLHIPESVYPNFDNIKKTFNDPKKRLKWRAKQNFDFGYLLKYCGNLSRYYLHIEDDVISAEGFIKDIKANIDIQKKKWALLEFSNLGFIGKLFHSEDLNRIADYIIKKYDDKPGDMLLGAIRQELGQPKPIHSSLSLFQHIGKFSSLENKLMPSIDGKFKDAGKVSLSSNWIPKGDNPPAKIETNMVPFETHLPVFAYDNDTTTYFWAKTPRKNDHLTLILNKPYNVSRIIIITGDPDRRADAIKYSELQIAVHNRHDLFIPNSSLSCGKFVKLGSMIDGDMDTKATGERIPENLVCLSIRITRPAKNWAIIRNIELFLNDK